MPGISRKRGSLHTSTARYQNPRKSAKPISIRYGRGLLIHCEATGTSVSTLHAAADIDRSRLRRPDRIPSARIPAKPRVFDLAFARSTALLPYQIYGCALDARTWYRPVTNDCSIQALWKRRCAVIAPPSARRSACVAGQCCVLPHRIIRTARRAERRVAPAPPGLE